MKLSSGLLGGAGRSSLCCQSLGPTRSLLGGAGRSSLIPTRSLLGSAGRSSLYGQSTRTRSRGWGWSEYRRYTINSPCFQEIFLNRENNKNCKLGKYLCFQCPISICSFSTAKSYIKTTAYRYQIKKFSSVWTLYRYGTLCNVHTCLVFANTSPAFRGAAWLLAAGAGCLRRNPPMVG